MSSPRARGDDAAFAQQTLLQSSRDRAVAASGRGSLIFNLFWLSPSVITPASILFSLPPASIPLPSRDREAKVGACGGREGYREDV